MRNHEVTASHPLLDERGNLREPGWSRHLVQQYDRTQVKAPRWRIKEWDYYLVMGRGFAGAFTISDDGYIGLQSVSLLGLGDAPWEHTETVLNTFHSEPYHRLVQSHIRKAPDRFPDAQHGRRPSTLGKRPCLGLAAYQDVP